MCNESLNIKNTLRQFGKEVMTVSWLWSRQLREAVQSS